MQQVGSPAINYVLLADPPYVMDGHGVAILNNLSEKDTVAAFGAISATKNH